MVCLTKVAMALYETIGVVRIPIKDYYRATYIDNC